eukprot:5561441-Alexandrium_andersonii.AAC.1
MQPSAEFRAAPKGYQLRDKTAFSACSALQARFKQLLARPLRGGLPTPRTPRKAPPAPCAGGAFRASPGGGGRPGEGVQGAA